MKTGKNKFMTGTLATGISLLILFLPNFVFAQSTSSATLEELQNELATLLAQVTVLQNKIAQYQGTSNTSSNSYNNSNYNQNYSNNYDNYDNKNNNYYEDDPVYYSNTYIKEFEDDYGGYDDKDYDEKFNYAYEYDKDDYVDNDPFKRSDKNPDRDPKIDILFPTGGEQIVPDGTLLVRWTSKGNVDIYLTDFGGNSLQTLGQNIPGTSYNASVNSRIYDRQDNKYKIRVCYAGTLAHCNINNVSFSFQTIDKHDDHKNNYDDY